MLNTTTTVTRESTICFPIRGSRILLGMKKERFGEGKWNGFGGKRKGHETIEEAAVRELEEESRLIANVNDLELVARIQFFKEETLLFNCAIFIVRIWHGIERETHEMRPQWFDSDAMPYDRMWAGDREWIPLVLAGLKFQATLRFTRELSAVKSFDYEDLGSTQ